MKRSREKGTYGHGPLNGKETEKNGDTVRRPSRLVRDLGEDVRSRMFVLASHSEGNDDGDEGTEVDEDEGLCDLCDNFGSERVEEAMDDEETDEDCDGVAGGGDISAVGGDGGLREEVG